MKLLKFDKNKLLKISRVLASKQCPLLKKCREGSGIDCTDREYKECELFKRVFSEKFGVSITQVEPLRRDHYQEI